MRIVRIVTPFDEPIDRVRCSGARGINYVYRYELKLSKAEGKLGAEVKWTLRLTDGGDAAGTAQFQENGRTVWQGSHCTVEALGLPKWDRFVLEASHVGTTARISLAYYLVWWDDLKLWRPVFQNEAAWSGQDTQRALQVLYGIYRTMPAEWRTHVPPFRTILSDDPSDGPKGVEMLAAVVRRAGEPAYMEVYRRSLPPDFPEFPVGMSSGNDDNFAEAIYHEFGHLLMAQRCGHPTLNWFRKAIAEARQDHARWKEVFNPWAIVPWFYQTWLSLMNSHLGDPVRDFMTEWCEATGWVIDSLDNVSWCQKTEAPNLLTALKELGLRNIRASGQGRNLTELYYQFKKVEAEYWQLKDAEPPDPAAIDAKKREKEALYQQLQEAAKKMGTPSQYATTSPDEDFAVSMSYLAAAQLDDLDASRLGVFRVNNLIPPELPRNWEEVLGIEVFIHQPRIAATSATTAGTRAVKAAAKSRKRTNAESLSEADEPEALQLARELAGILEDTKALRDKHGGDALDKISARLSDAAIALALPVGTDSLVPLVCLGEGPSLWSAEICAEPGDVVVEKSGRALQVLECDRSGGITTLCGNFTLKESKNREAPTCDPAGLVLHVRPAFTPREWPQGKAEFPVTPALCAALAWWRQEETPAGHDLSDGAAFAFAYLKEACGLKIQVPSLPIMEEVRNFCESHGDGLQPCRAGVQPLPGSLLFPMKGEGVAVMLGSRGGTWEVLFGGEGPTGHFGEGKNPVRWLGAVPTEHFVSHWMPSSKKAGRSR